MAAYLVIPAVSQEATFVAFIECIDSGVVLGDSKFQEELIKRCLAAILCAEVVGYSRFMCEGVVRTLAAWQK